MYFDGSVMKEGVGVVLVFISPLGVHLEYMVRLHFPASSNITEYEALINGLRIAVELGIRRIEIRGDSELVVDQVMKEKNCVDPKMEAYCQAVRELEDKFHRLELHHVLRDHNKVVDILDNTASSRKSVPTGSSRATNTRPLYEQKGRSRQKLNNRRSWRSTNRPSRTLRILIGIFLSSSGLSRGSFPPTR
jgi:ribonuclease HI